MSDTITPTLNPIENNSASTVTVESPSVLAPQISERDAFAMDLGDLKKAAFDQAAPAPVAQPQATPEPYTLTQEGNTFVLKYATGEVFKGGSEIEAYRKAAENAVRNIEYAKQLKSQLSAQPQPQQLPDPAMQQVTAEDEAQARQFIRNFVGLTPEYETEAASRGLAKVLGVDPQALPQQVQGIASTVQEFQANNMAIEFHRRCPDYVGLPEQTQALEQALRTLDRIPTIEDVEKLWAYATYKNPQLHYVPPTSTPAPRPPVMPSATAPSLTGDQDPMKIPLDDLKRLAGLA